MAPVSSNRYSAAVVLSPEEISNKMNGLEEMKFELDEHDEENKEIGSLDSPQDLVENWQTATLAERNSETGSVYVAVVPNVGDNIPVASNIVYS